MLVFYTVLAAMIHCGNAFITRTKNAVVLDMCAENKSGDQPSVLVSAAARRADRFNYKKQKVKCSNKFIWICKI